MPSGREPEHIDRVDAAGADDILHDNVWLAGNKATQKLLEDARLDIGIAAGTIVDQQGERLVLVELGRGTCRGKRRKNG
jgi:hypothetical protein